VRTTSDNRQGNAIPPSSDRLTGLLLEHNAALQRQPLSAHTRRAYRIRVHQYADYLRSWVPDYGDPLQDPHTRDYKMFLKTMRRAKPRTVNLSLAAIDHFYEFLGLGKPTVRREELPQQAPSALSPEDQKRFLRAVERTASSRDQALALLLFYTGIRIGECAALDVDDLLLSARRGQVIVRSGKGDSYREIPLNAQVRPALKAWLQERRQQLPLVGTLALFLNRQGQRLSSRSIDLVLRRLGEGAGLTLSAHTLRHTCLTALVRQGTDLMLVAEIAGHKRLETTRRYCLPTAQDQEAAMDRLQIDY
jgi:site-specific recombinase XerD